MTRRALLAALILVGCASVSGSRPSNVTPAFDEHPPRSVYVFPPNNKSSDFEASGVVQRLLENGMAKRGFRVGTGADATLHSVVERYGRELQLSLGRARACVRVSAKLYDNASGALLWSGDESAFEEADDDRAGDRDFLDSVLDFALDEAVEPVFHDTRDVAKEAVWSLLSTFPDAPDA